MSRYSFDQEEGYGGGAGMPQLAFPTLTPVVKMLMIACGALQLVQFVVAGGLTEWLGIGWSSFSNLSVLGVLNLVTYQFVHSYERLGHILMNMLVLYFFGTMVEEGIGSRRFLRLYLFSGIAGGVFWLVFSAILGITGFCLGASGACFGVMTYAAFTRPNARVIFIIVFVRLWWLVAILGVFAIYQTSLALRHGSGSRVADAAHLGGMAFAAAWWKWGGLLGGLGERLQVRANERERRRERERDKEVDRLLAKIKEIGMSGLTASERRFLKRYSRDRR